MKKRTRILAIGGLLLTLMSPAFGQIGHLPTAQLSDAGRLLETVILYNFEQYGKWDVRGSQFFIEDRKATNRSYTNTHPIVENGSEFLLPQISNYPYTSRQLGVKKNLTTNCLGITTAFSRKGYNYFDVFVDYEQAKANGLTNEMGDRRIPGIVQQIDLWVWGGGFDYSLDMYVEDFRGYAHKLSYGSLLYHGWKYLHVRVPKSIPQYESWSPMVKGMRFLFFRVSAAPYERCDRMHIFLDFFTCVTDLYDEQYDGRELQDLTREIGLGEGNPPSAPVEEPSGVRAGQDSGAALNANE